MTHYLTRVIPAALLLALAAVLAGGGTAAADIEPGNIPAQTIQTAYPTQPGATYDGALQPDTGSGYHDLDYLAVTVANAGETLEFTLQNTTQGVDPSAYEWCPVYMSILDQTNNLVGGQGSGAGTVATYQDTEVFDWTFSAPGTYYLVLESNGDMPAGRPTYAVSYRIVSAGDATHGAGQPGASEPTPGHPPTAPAGPLVRSLRVLEKQHGHGIIATIGLSGQSSLVAEVLMPGVRKPIALKRVSLTAGSHELLLRLPALEWRAMKHSGLSLQLRISVRGASGASVTYERPVTVSR